MSNGKFEVELPQKARQQLMELVDRSEWEAFNLLANLLCEKARDDLEKGDGDEQMLRGELKRLRRFLRLRTDLLASK